MNKQQKKRLCWNCEGNVSLELEICPFCGVSVVPAVLDEGQTHFAPSYQTAQSAEMGIPRSPYAQETEKETLETEQKEAKVAESALDDFKTTLLSILFLLTGAAFGIFGLILGLFSVDGIFRLEWDGSLWFIYCVVGLPMLLFGWRLLRQIKD